MSDCTVERHTAEVVTAAQNAFSEGHRSGVLHGHRKGYDQGYSFGYSEGLRSSDAYKTGHAEGFNAGYLERISDESGGGAVE